MKKLTFLHKLSPANPILDLCLVLQAGLGHECFVQTGAGVVVAEGVVSDEVEEIFTSSSEFACCGFRDVTEQYLCRSL